MKNAPRPRSKRIDWPAAKIEYVTNGAVTHAQIAAKYKTLETTVRKRASDENWTADRQARATILVQKATEKSVMNAIEELARYNEQDLMAAKALRSLVAKRMQESHQRGIEPKDLRSLAGAVESAQRVARLALGASTENTDTRISEADRMTPEERRERLRQLHAQLFPTTVQ